MPWGLSQGLEAVARRPALRPALLSFPAALTSVIRGVSSAWARPASSCVPISAYAFCCGAVRRLEAGAPGFRYLASSAVSSAEPFFALNDVDDGEELRSTLDAMAIVRAPYHISGSSAGS